MTRATLLPAFFMLQLCACSGDTRSDPCNGVLRNGAKKRFFVTSTFYTGDLTTAGGAKGVLGGDNLCTSVASAAGLGGVWRAWLSDSTANAIDRICDVSPWYLIDGTSVVFAKGADLMAQPAVAILTNEMGNEAGNDTWTGTLTGGARASTNCRDWSTSDATVHGRAGGGSSDLWTDSDRFHPGVDGASCSDSLSLYCFEQ